MAIGSPSFPLFLTKQSVLEKPGGGAGRSRRSRRLELVGWGMAPKGMWQAGGKI